MPKRNVSDIMFQQIKAPKYKEDMSVDVLGDILIKRLGLKRRESKAKHKELLKKLIDSEKPLSFEDVKETLGVSQAQTYEELRKWRTIGILKFVYHGDRGYVLVSKNMAELIEKVRKEINTFLDETKNIAVLYEEMKNKDKIKI